jgi:hypothetical protein
VVFVFLFSVSAFLSARLSPLENSLVARFLGWVAGPCALKVIDVSKLNRSSAEFERGYAGMEA